VVPSFRRPKTLAVPTSFTSGDKVRNRHKVQSGLEKVTITQGEIVDASIACNLLLLSYVTLPLYAQSPQDGRYALIGARTQKLDDRPDLTLIQQAEISS
jgi:hypothetical protein